MFIHFIGQKKAIMNIIAFFKKSTIKEAFLIILLEIYK